MVINNYVLPNMTPTATYLKSGLYMVGDATLEQQASAAKPHPNTYKQENGWVAVLSSSLILNIAWVKKLPIVLSYCYG